MAKVLIQRGLDSLEQVEAPLPPAVMGRRTSGGARPTERFREVLERLLSELPGRRFEQAGEVLQALKAVPMPESTGPMPSSERTVVLAPAVLASAELPAALPQAVVSPSPLYFLA